MSFFSELGDTIGGGLISLADSKIQKEIRQGDESEHRAESVRPEPSPLPPNGEIKAALESVGQNSQIILYGVLAVSALAAGVLMFGGRR